MEIGDLELQKLTEVVARKNLSMAQVIELIEDCSIQSKKIININDEILLTVDYRKTLGQAIIDGNYDWANNDIEARNFPISSDLIGRKVDIAVKLFHFSCDISSLNAISAIDKSGYRPATLMELLVLGFLFPELQKQFPIVALGSVWQSAGGNSCVPCLSVNGSKRELDLHWFVSGWLDHCRFLGVRK